MPFSFFESSSVMIFCSFMSSPPFYLTVLYNYTRARKKTHELLRNLHLISRKHRLVYRGDETGYKRNRPKT